MKNFDSRVVNDRIPEGSILPPQLETEHILLPSGLREHERPALQLASRLAMASSACLTLFHVVHPPFEQTKRPSVHWLDAIDMLHQSRGSTLSRTTHENFVAHIEALRKKMSAEIERCVPLEWRTRISIDSAIGVGDVESEIKRFVVKQGVRVIVRTPRLFRRLSVCSWWQRRKSLRFAPVEILLQQTDPKGRPN